MKAKKQSSLPGKYWLLILAVICVILMGIDQRPDRRGPLKWHAN